MDNKISKTHKKEVEKQVKKALKEEEKILEKKIEKRLHEKLFSSSKQTVMQIHATFKGHASTAIIAALSFLIALSWKDLIVGIVKENIKIDALSKYPYLLELYSAFIITIVAIIGIAIVSRWANKEN